VEERVSRDVLPLLVGDVVVVGREGGREREREREREKERERDARAQQAVVHIDSSAPLH
jgi:hypothetical protein